MQCGPASVSAHGGTGIPMGLLGFFFGKDHHSRAQRDQWRPSVVGKNLLSPVHDCGTCFACEGAGKRTLTCRACQGTGQYVGDCRHCRGTGACQRPAQICFTCSGQKTVRGQPCRRCRGTGEFRPATSVVCARCQGTGRFQAACRQCSGKGIFTVTCRKCAATGWHRF